MADNYELSKRYSKALFQSVDTPEKREAVLVELRTIWTAIKKDTSVHEVFLSPLVSIAKKQELIESLFVKKYISDETKSFLKLLIKRARFSVLSDIVEAYQQETDSSNGIIRGSVVSARALTADQAQELGTKISKATNKKTILEYSVDDSLIGGMVAQVGSYKFDDSLNTQLNLMREKLKRRSH